VFSQRYYTESYTQADLGHGFDQQRHKSEARCLKGQVIYHSAMSGELDYLQRLNATQVRRRTFGEVHGGVNLFIIAGSVSTSITHRNATDNLSLTSQLHLKFDEGYSTLENRQLVAGYENNNCGNSFIYQLDYGRDIFINMRLHFRSEADYKRFVTKIKIRLLFFKKTISKVKLIEKYAANAVLSIDANSNAPLPTQLTTLLNNNKRHCRGSDISPCLTTLQRLSDYVFRDSGLASDLQAMERAPRGITTRSYNDSGHYFSQTYDLKIEPEYDHIWQTVESRYGAAVRRLERAKAFFAVADNDERDAAQLEMERAADWLNEMEDIRSLCMKTPWSAECS
jgi:hypothetical protein